ncbi:MAG: DUF2206 domain-containing protein [Candidatus Baldrarchaeia archaeon]
MAEGKSKDFLLFILFLQLIVYVTVLLDVPVARQVIVFLYFIFIPGFVIVRLLKLNEIEWVEKLLLSVGLSVAFLMLTGLLINELGPLFGISEPLSTMPSLVFLNTLIIIFAFVVCWRGDSIKLGSNEHLILSPLMLIFIILPILAIVGAMCVNAYGNNLLLLFMIMAISSLFIVCVLPKKALSSALYPFAILMIATALLYHSTFISNYFVTLGSDITVEYFAFKVTQNSAHWGSINPYVRGEWSGYGRLNSMLSITVLPTLFSSLLNMDATWMFKIVFPLIFSLVPLGLYQIWQLYLGKKYAFISAFMFMAEMTFYTEMLRLSRQMVAELFFVLLLLVIANRHIKSARKIFLFVIFSFALATSHYGVAVIFLFFISATVISLIVLRHPSKKITVSMVIFFFVIMFSWYVYTSRSAVFDSFLEFGDYVLRQLNDFLNPASRGEAVLRGLGLEAPPTVWNMVSRAFAYITEALIVTGFIGLITKRVKVSFDAEYSAFIIFSMGFLATLILIPGLANTMNMTRFYHVLLFFLAPLSVLGAETIVNMIRRRNTEVKVAVLVLVILVPYFLFQTNFVYEVTGSESWSVPLSLHRMNGYKLYRLMGYIPKENVFGSYWLSRYVDTQDIRVYADADSLKVLIAYGLIYLGRINLLSNTTRIEDVEVIYLGKLSVVHQTIVGRDIWNSSELSFLFSNVSKIYSNGACDVYKR